MYVFLMSKKNKLIIYFFTLKIIFFNFFYRHVVEYFIMNNMCANINCNEYL